MPDFIIIGPVYGDMYQKMYAGTYLLSFVAVVVLYGLIYKSIHEHRAKRSIRKQSSLCPAGVISLIRFVNSDLIYITCEEILYSL
jgi:membrane-anchored protein YejM (alkaline phosphatase superfamily)